MNGPGWGLSHLMASLLALARLWERIRGQKIYMYMLRFVVLVEGEQYTDMMDTSAVVTWLRWASLVSQT